MKEVLNKCTLCPKNCQVNRNKGEIGFCKSTNKIKISKYYLHKWEEPPITGKNGSGTIFFTNCNMRCIFCQNYYISAMGNGKEITEEEFSNICLELQHQGATNINLVTPTHYVPLIVEGLTLAKAKGLNIPIVYNTSSYENVETIKMLKELVDVYLPDLKYYNNTYSLKYSHVKNYFEYAKKAIYEMYKQVGKPVFNEDGDIIKGVIVRHLLLPGMYTDSRKIIKYLHHKYHNKILISIMNQYTPVKKCQYQELNKKVSEKEYNSIIDYSWKIGVRNAFIQEGETQNESFIPDFTTFHE